AARALEGSEGLARLDAPGAAVLLELVSGLVSASQGRRGRRGAASGSARLGRIPRAERLARGPAVELEGPRQRGRQIAALRAVLLDDQVGRVGCDDSVLLAEPHDLLLHLPRLAAQAHLLEEVSDLAHGPEAGDVAVLAAGEGQRVLEDALLALELAAE